MRALPKTISQIYGIQLFPCRLETQGATKEQGVSGVNGAGAIITFVAGND